MKRNFTRSSLLLASMLLVFACGRNETTASKSAAAHREAQAKEIPVTGGHEHAGHEAPALSTTTATMDHSAHGTGADPHAGHAMTGHARTAGGTASHGAHGATSRTAAHDQHAGMQHGTAPASTDPHAHHRQPANATGHAAHGAMQQPSATAPRVVSSAPTTNAEIARTQPAATLQPDDFDAPSPIAVEEARKAAGGGGHEDHDAGGQTVYICPMHPEVTSATPGNCPKCGMALVKKEK